MSISAPVKLTTKDYKSELHNDWCPGCIRPETPIVMADGTRVPIRDVRVGDLVLGHDGKPHHVTEVMSHWHPTELHRVGVQFLGAMTLTSDHPVWCATRTGEADFHLDWRPAGALRPGDQIAMPASALAREREFAGAVGRLNERMRDGKAGTDRPYVLLTIESNEVVPYQGFVHNLEVEGSHSYVT